MGKFWKGMKNKGEEVKVNWMSCVYFLRGKEGKKKFSCLNSNKTKVWRRINFEKDGQEESGIMAHDWKRF